MSTRRQIGVLIAVFLAALVLVTGTGMSVVTLVRARVLRLSEETAPMQVKLARVQRRFERISADFARMGGAASEAELAALEKSAGDALAEVGRIARGLGTQDAISPQELDRLSEVLRGLAAIARQRNAGRAAIDRESTAVSRELAAAAQATQAMGAAMEQLEKEAQASLLESKQQSQRANAAIRALFLFLEKAGALSGIVGTVGGVESRYKLNPLRDKAKGVLDAISAVETEGRLQASARSFAAAMEKDLLGEGGLLAARAAALSKPGDAESKKRFEDAARGLQQRVEEFFVVLAEGLDPLELATFKANESMNQSTDRIAQVSAVASAAGEVTAAARSLSASAWQLLVARNEDEVKRVRIEAQVSLDRAGAAVGQLRKLLGALQRREELAAAEHATASILSVREQLLGSGGVAEVVGKNLAAQARAQELQGAAARAIEQMTGRSGARAAAAESSQEDAVAGIARLSSATTFALALVGAAAVGLVLLVGGRIRRGILAAEAQEKRHAAGLRSLVARLAENTTLLRTVSQELHKTSTRMGASAQDTSGAVEAASLASRQIALSVTSASSLVDAGREGVRGVARDAQEAAVVGRKAVGLVGEARTAVGRLGEASVEIGSAVSLIERIAGQTNLLALNALIEAHVAGEAGRGFAVVAAEVKELARATAQATSEIQRRTKAIQDQTGGVVQEMDEVARIIAQVESLQHAIAASTEEQTANASSISSSVSAAAESGQSIAGAVASVHEASQATVRSSEQVLGLSERLAAMADELGALCADATGSRAVAGQAVVAPAGPPALVAVALPPLGQAAF